LSNEKWNLEIRLNTKKQTVENHIKGANLKKRLSANFTVSVLILKLLNKKNPAIIKKNSTQISQCVIPGTYCSSVPFIILLK